MSDVAIIDIDIGVGPKQLCLYYIVEVGLKNRREVGLVGGCPPPKKKNRWELGG